MRADSFELLHVVAPARTGGLERVVAMLSSEQRRTGHDVGVAAILEPGRAPHPLVEDLRSREVRVFEVVVPHRAYLREVRELRNLFSRRGPDVVHTHGYHADVIAGIVARRLDMATVSTVHGFTGGGWKNRAYERLQRWSLRKFDAVVAVSRDLGAELAAARIDPGRIHVVANAWRSATSALGRSRARQRLGLPEDAFVVGWVGRLSREKGPDVLVRAAERVDEPRSVFSMVGEGSEAARVEALARDLGIEDRVVFHGLVPDAAELYRAFDVFVISSRSEGTPMALFEALDAEVPVVAAEVGGIPDVVGRQEAVLVPPEDPSALAEAIRAVAADPEAAAERARRARRRLNRRFDTASWVRRYDEVYRDAGAGQVGGLP